MALNGPHLLHLSTELLDEIVLSTSTKPSPTFAYLPTIAPSVCQTSLPLCGGHWSKCLPLLFNTQFARHDHIINPPLPGFLQHTRSYTPTHFPVSWHSFQLFFPSCRGDVPQKHYLLHIENVAVVPDSLPNLIRLRISSDLSFIQLSNFQKITSLQIETIETPHDVQSMLESLTDGGSNQANISLVKLSLSLSSNNTIKIVESLQKIGQIMLAVKYLSINNHNINALVSHSSKF